MLPQTALGPEARFGRGTGRIARTLFVIEGDVMVLLHAFIKKQQKTPQPELDLRRPMSDGVSVAHSPRNIRLPDRISPNPPPMADPNLSKLDALTTEAQRAIDLLQERRTELISAAVTGQIDVRPP